MKTFVALVIGSALAIPASVRTEQQVEAARDAQRPLPAFEVASIRVNKTGDLSRSIRPMPGGRLEATNVPLRNLIRFAYEVRTLDEIERGPQWIDSIAFDIVARGAPDESQPLMMRTLLAERFKLLAHTETREQAAYALVPARKDAKPGPAIAPSSADCAIAGSCYRRSGPTRLEIRGQPVSELVRSVSVLVGRPVVDRTGLAGPYDLTMDFSPEQLPGALRVQAPVDAGLPSIFTALQEQLGLRLEAIRAPVSFLIVDRAEMPTEN